MSSSALSGLSGLSGLVSSGATSAPPGTGFIDNNLVFPANFAEVLNVTDSTAGQAGANALIPNSVGQAASNQTKLATLIAANSGALSNSSISVNKRSLYFPNGIYYLTNRIFWCKDLTILGQSREGTILKLADDNSTNFPSSSLLKFFIDFAASQDDNQGFGFNNYMHNITIDIGNNINASAFGFYGNNNCNLSNIKIKSDGPGIGVVGIGCRTGAFPAAFSRVKVEGFQYGVIGSSASNFYDLEVTGQSVYGIGLGTPSNLVNWAVDVPEVAGTQAIGGGSGQGGCTLSVFRFKSTQSQANVPAVFSATWPTGLNTGSLGAARFISIVKGEMIGNGGPAVVIGANQPESTRPAFVHLESITQTGYSCILHDRANKLIAGTASIGQHGSKNQTKIVNEVPLRESVWDQFPNLDDYNLGQLPNPATSKWTILPLTLGGNTADDYAAIQAIFDDVTNDVIYLPRQQSSWTQYQSYRTTDTIKIRGDRGGRDFYFVSFGARIDPEDNTFDAKPLYRVENIGGGKVYFISIRTVDNNLNDPFELIHHASSGDLIMIECSGVNAAGSSKAGVGYRIAPDFTGTPGKFIGVSALLSSAIFNQAQTALLLNANWIGTESSSVLNTPIFRVLGGSKVLAIGPRQENTGTTRERLALVSGTGSLFAVQNSFIDPSGGGSLLNVSSMYQLESGGTFHGHIMQHASNTQCYRRLVGINRGSQVTVSIDDSPQPLPDPIGNKTIVSTGAMSSFGGTGTIPAPVLVSAIVGNLTDVDATKLTIAYDLPLLASSVPSTGSFAITVGGSSRAVTAVTMANQCIVLTLASAVASGAAVVLNYTAGGSPIKGASGVNAANLSSLTVTNLV
jgi:hypothetical protein